MISTVPLAMVIPIMAGLGQSCSAARVEPEVELPDVMMNEAVVPYRPADAALQGKAETYCAESGMKRDEVDFFLGYLPLAVFEALCEGIVGDAEIDSVLGELFVSGYFGGVWLRDVLGANEPSGGGGAGGSLALVSPILDSSRAGIVAAGAADSGELIERAGSEIEFLLSLYGYNLGYLEYVSAHPPPGSAEPAPFECASFLGCDYAVVQFGPLKRYAAHRPKLEAPPNAVWQEAEERVRRAESVSRETGRSVWEGILGANSMAAEHYPTLLDLSRTYLAIAEAAVWASLVGWADRDAMAAGCGLRMSAGLTAWSGSYFAGLASSLPKGTFPRLTCP